MLNLYHLNYNFVLAAQKEQILLIVQTCESYMMPIKKKKQQLHTVLLYIFQRNKKEECAIFGKMPQKDVGY